MSIKDYQKRIDDSLKIYKKPYWHPLSQMARLSEETGEVARILNHLYGDKPKKIDEKHEDLSDELADVLFTVMCLANSNDIDLDAAMDRAIAKHNTRDKDRFAKKSSQDV